MAVSTSSFETPSMSLDDDSTTFPSRPVTGPAPAHVKAPKTTEPAKYEIDLALVFRYGYLGLCGLTLLFALPISFRGLFRLLETVLGVILGAAGGGALAWGHYKMARRKVKDKLRMKVRMSPAVIETLLGELPPWVTAKKDDQFFTTMFTRMWPYYQTAISSQTKLQMDPMLDYYKPNQLNVLNFKKFDLGPIAPEFGQMRMRGENTPRGREMVLEMSLRWIAKPDIRIAAELKGGFRVVPKIQNLTVSGNLKLTMGPLRSDLFYPCFSALVVSMPEVPKINFDISYGHTMDVVKKMLDPILKGMIPGVIDSSLEMFVPPNYFTLPMYHLFFDAQRNAYKDDEIKAVLEQFTYFPEGLLKVRVESLNDLEPPPVVVRKGRLRKIGGAIGGVVSKPVGMAVSLIRREPSQSREMVTRLSSQIVEESTKAFNASLKPIVDLFVDNGAKFTAKGAKMKEGKFLDDTEFSFDADKNTFYIMVSEPQNSVLHVQCRDLSTGKAINLGRTKMTVGKIRKECPISQQMLDSGAPPHAVSDYYTIGYQQWKASAFQGAGSIRMQLSYAPNILLSKLESESGLLVTRLKSGTNLPITDWNGKSDPFVVMTLRDPYARAPTGPAEAPGLLDLLSPLKTPTKKQKTPKSAKAKPGELSGGGGVGYSPDLERPPSAMSEASHASSSTPKKRFLGLFGKRDRQPKSSPIGPVTPGQEGRDSLLAGIKGGAENGGGGRHREVTKVSDVKKNTLDPVWNRTFEWQDARVNDVLDVKLYDKDIDGADLVGEMTLKIRDIMEAPDHSVKGSFPLRDPAGKPIPHTLLQLDFWYLPHF